MFVYRDGLKGGPVSLSNSQTGPCKYFSQHRVYILVHLCIANCSNFLRCSRQPRLMPQLKLLMQCPPKLSLFFVAHGDAEHAPEGEQLELKLDFNTPTSGPVAISYVGDMTPLKILDNNCQLQEINANSGPKSVNLPNTRAWRWVRFSFDLVVSCSDRLSSSETT